HLDGWKGPNCFGVEIAVPVLIVLDGQSKTVTHEFQITMNGFGADLEFLRYLWSIWIATLLDQLMNALHPLEWQTRKRRRRFGCFGPRFHDSKKRETGTRPVSRQHNRIKPAWRATRRWSCAFSRQPTEFPLPRWDSNQPSYDAACG